MAAKKNIPTPEQVLGAKKRIPTPDEVLKKKEEPVGEDTSPSLEEGTISEESLEYTPEEIAKFDAASVNPRTLMAFDAATRKKYVAYTQSKADKYKVTEQDRETATQNLEILDQAMEEVDQQMSEVGEGGAWWKEEAATQTDEFGVPQPTEGAEKLNLLRTQKKLIRDAKTYSSAVSKGDKQSALERFWEGAKTLDVANVVSLGISDLIQGVEVGNIARKLEDQGLESLSQDERDILILDNIRQQAEQSAMKDRSFAVGAGVAETVPFVVDMVVTSGIGAGIRKGTFKAAGTIKSKAARKLVANLSDATTRSLLFPSTYEAVSERTAPTVGFNEDTEPIILEGGEDLIEALPKAIGSNAVEIFSEGAIGAGLSKVISKASSKGLRLMRNTKVGDVVESVSKAAKNSPLLKAASIQDPLTEFGEEVFAGIVQPIVTGDGSPMDFFEYENMVRTMLTVSVMSSAMTAPSTAAAMVNAKKIKDGETAYASLDDINKDIFNQSLQNETVDQVQEKLQALHMNMLDEDSSTAGIKAANRTVSRLSDYYASVKKAEREANKIKGASYQFGNRVFTDKEKFFKRVEQAISKGETTPIVNVRNDNESKRQLDQLISGVEVEREDVAPAPAQTPPITTTTEVTPETETAPVKTTEVTEEATPEVEAVATEPVEVPQSVAEARSSEDGTITPEETKEAPTEAKTESKFPKPPAPISELDGEGIREYSKTVKEYEKNLIDEVFGEDAKKYRALESKSNRPTISREEGLKVDAEMQAMIESLPKEKKEMWDEAPTYDAAELRDMARRVELVEESNNIGELSSSLKEPLMNFRKNKEKEDTLAVFNAARKKAVELGIKTEDLIKQTSRLIARDFRDPVDAEDMVRDALSAIAETAEATTQASAPKQIQEATKKVADTLRKAKFIQTMDDLSKLSSDPTAVLKVAWDGSVELAAKTIEAGGTIAQAVSDGLKSLKESDWYKNLSDSSKKIAEERFTSDITKHLQDAQGTTQKAKEASKQEKGVEPEAEGQIRLGDTSKDRKEEKVTPKYSLEGKQGKAEKISRFVIRATLEATDLPDSVKKEIDKRGLGQKTVITDKQAQSIVDEIASNSDVETMKAIVLDQGTHGSIAGSLIIKIKDYYNERYYAAEKRGDEKAMAESTDDLLDFIEALNSNVNRSALLLRSLGTQAFFDSFAPYQKVRFYKRSVEAERKRRTSNPVYEKYERKARRDVKKAHEEAVDGALATPRVRKIIEANKEKIESPVKPDRLKELKRKEKELKEKWRKARKGSLSAAIIPGLTQADIEFGGELAINYLEQAAYHVGKATKKLVKAFKEVGLNITEADARKLMPQEIDGAPIDKKLEEEVTQKAAERLASRIFGEVIVTKPKDDPLSQMVNTLLSKFRERDVKDAKKEAKTDIEKIADAIRNRDEYKDVWAEAKQSAIDLVEKNESMTEEESEAAIARINESYENATSFTFTESQVDRAIRKKLGDLDMRINDIVKEHFSTRISKRKKLSDALIEESGLSEQQSKELAKAIEEKFDTMIKESANKIINRYVEKSKKPKTETAKIDVQAKDAAIEELFKLINVGAFDSPEFRDAYATANGIPVFNQKHADMIRKLAEEVKQQPRATMKHQKAQLLTGYMSKIKGMGANDIFTTIWFGNVLSGIKTQERNFIGSNTGVGARVLSEAIKTGRIIPLMEGAKRGMSSGANKARQTIKTGYSTITGKIDIPAPAESINAPGLIGMWVEFSKYVGRIMSANDILSATWGKEAFAQLLAHEAMSVNSLKYLFNKEYQNEIKNKVNDYLAVDKVTVDRIKEEVESEAKEFGYSDLDKKLILYDEIDRLRPLEITEQANRFGLFATGNVQSYGTLGSIVDGMASTMRAIEIKILTDKTGKEYKIRPLALLAAFTKITTNVVTQSMNYVPGIGYYRVRIGGYGASFKDKAGKERYFVELTDREKKTVMAQQLLGLASMAFFAAMSEPGDDDDPFLRITANGTGSYDKNKSLKDWKEYSIGVRVGKDRIWVSYKYTPLFLPLGMIGMARDMQKYNQEHKDDDFTTLMGNSFASMLSMIGDMSTVSALSGTISSMFGGGVASSAEQVAKNLLRTVTGFYTPTLYKDAVGILEYIRGVEVEGRVKGESALDFVRRAFLGQQPVSVALKLVGGKKYYIDRDAYGIPIKRFMPWNEFLDIEAFDTREEQLRLIHQKRMDNPSLPNIGTTSFIVLTPEGGMKRILLDPRDEAQLAIWDEYVKTRGKLIIDAIDQNKEYPQEVYEENMNRVFNKADKVAKAMISDRIMTVTKQGKDIYKIKD